MRLSFYIIVLCVYVAHITIRRIFHFDYYTSLLYMFIFRKQLGMRCEKSFFPYKFTSFTGKLKLGFLF